MDLSNNYPVLLWIKSLPPGEFVRSTWWAFPTLQSLHFCGMAMVIGIVGLLDLRTLGLAKSLPIRPLHRLLPLAWIGFGLNLCTGLMFFMHDPFVYAFNRSFRWKLLFILLAGVNALWFELGVFTNLERWQDKVETSNLAKVISAISLALWVAVIFGGRYIAFTNSAAPTP
jgi:hypothetical protein